MLRYNLLDWTIKGVKEKRLGKGMESAQIAFILNSTVLYITGVDKWFADILESADKFVISSLELTDPYNLVQYGEHYIDVIIDNIVINTIICSDQMMSIFLNSEKIINFTNNSYAEDIDVGWIYSDRQFTKP